MSSLLRIDYNNNNFGNVIDSFNGLLDPKTQDLSY